MNPSPVLKIQDARKKYGATEALRGLSLELRSGEMLGLLGPNGAGKTTLIRSISGRVRLDSGNIELFGKALNGGGREALGVVPQEVAVYPLLTARENLEAFGSLSGLTGAKLRERVRWALEWTGLADRTRESVKAFSGGMKRRLNIACAVLHEPRVLLLDEPTVGVDPQSRERIYEMLQRLRETGASLLLATHQLEEAQARCDRIVIQDHGQVIAEGSLADLVSRTLGQGRQVVLRVESEPAKPLQLDGGGWSGREFTTQMRDVSAELPALMSRLGAAGCVIEDLEVRSPSLQSVFLKLTGRELRE